MICVYCVNTTIFLSTLSLRRATPVRCAIWTTTGISIHTLLAESDKCFMIIVVQNVIFLSTLSLRRATSRAVNNATINNISIHTLLAESDCYLLDRYDNDIRISIHTLLAESDVIIQKCFDIIFAFLSTLSLRRATNSFFDFPVSHSISIHTLLAESDH